MERKTKHRILGTLVVIGLIVIMLPFFQTTQESPVETALVKAPPFPDQAIQVSADMPTQIPIQQTSTLASSDDSINQQPDETIHSQSDKINKQQPNVIGIKTPFAENNNTQTEPNKAVINQSDTVPPQLTPLHDSPKVVTAQRIPVAKKLTYKNKQHVIAKHTRAVKILSASLLKAPIDDNGLFKLKDAVWVIQVGSFKNKAHALRLVNQLRANGYSAFIQQIAAAFDQSTQVFVGPENKQAKARSLASQLANEMHINGIVISYKPLTL